MLVIGQSLASWRRWPIAEVSSEVAAAKRCLFLTVLSGPGAGWAAIHASTSIVTCYFQFVFQGYPVKLNSARTMLFHLRVGFLDNL